MAKKTSTKNKAYTLKDAIHDLTDVKRNFEVMAQGAQIATARACHQEKGWKQADVCLYRGTVNGLEYALGLLDDITEIE